MAFIRRKEDGVYKTYTFAELEQELARIDQEYREQAKHIYDEDEQPVIIRQFGTWAVTEYGLECLVYYYPIEKERLKETWDWLLHMADKGDGKIGKLSDFIHAFECAQRYHYPKRYGIEERRKINTPVGTKKKVLRKTLSKATRFKVFKRDNYKCQICGFTATDNVQLEVDHKIPVARGGGNKMDNLWTLCIPCNRGKSAREL